MSYNPPENHHYTHAVEAYDSGYLAGKNGEPESANPYTPSGHERDTTYEDEMHYQWYRGWVDASEGDK